ncbi:MAG: hypothetical protein CMA00_001525 [Methanobacteriota archaeon]|nr:MAG: hypothetical protein CMA00_001525 [Euryarchaeota archaeon]
MPTLKDTSPRLESPSKQQIYSISLLGPMEGDEASIGTKDEIEDSDPSGQIAAEIDEENVDRIDIELDRIRERRTNPESSFLVNTMVPRTVDDYTLVFGLISGLVFFGLISVASSGLVLGDSIAVDETLSGTVLDPSECVDRRGQVWVETWVEGDDLLIRSNNVPPSSSAIIVFVSNGSSIPPDIGAQSETEIDLFIGGLGNLDLELSKEELADGDYWIQIVVLYLENSSDDWSIAPIDEIYEKLNESLNQDGWPGVTVKELEIELHTTDSSFFGSGETHRKMEKFDEDPRTCFTIQKMGAWGWGLMAAEWIGGRETAMLTGGSAEVPPWYMAMVSLGMSIFFLCVQYPLMHRLYHRETDDLLSSDQMGRLIQRTVESASKRLHIRPDLESMKVQDRAISVDVYLTYANTRRTIVSPIEIKGTLIKDILSEFRIFGEMRPLQIKTVRTDSSSESETSFSEKSILSQNTDEIELSEDYTEFFSRMGQFGNLEEAFRESMLRWFKKNQVLDYGSAIMADEDAVFVRVIYRPITKFAYFLFKQTYQHLQGDLRDHLGSDLEHLLEGRELVVSARNEKSTLADRAVAGRVEQGFQDLTGEAMVAKRGGIPGALLQNPFMGDILSSVEYVAYKNRPRIDRYGFWGLIVFVWIPFMASGVLVGAMLGLVARMRFERVLAACFIGGTAASITWAYTAKGIIEFMEKYHAEALIPFVILLAIAFTMLKIRDNKRHRREELFRDSMAFFAGASES